MKRHILRHLPAIVGVGLFLAIFSVCASANAQWLPDRAYAEGPGIKLGERFVLHPGVAARVGYDSNVFRNDENENGSGLIAITPHFNIASVGGQRMSGEGEGSAAPSSKLELASGASVSYIRYFEDLPPRGVEADIDGSLTLFPGKPVNASVDLSYQRTIRPFTQAAGPNQNYDRNAIRPGARLGFQSKGEVLTASVGYRPDIRRYGNSGAENQDFTYLDGELHNIPMDIGWKFFPHTALLYDGQIGFQKYQNPNDSESPVALSDGTLVRSRLGLNGAVTKTISIRGMAGYGAGFLDNPELDEFQLPLGEVSLTYRFRGERNALSLRYQHDVSPSATGAWQEYDKGTFDIQFLLARVLSVSADASVGKYTFGRVVDQDGVGLGVDDSMNREDLRVSAGLHAEYRVTDYLAFLADLTVRVVDTDFVYATEMIAFPDPAEFTVYQAFGGIRAFY